MRSAAGAGTSVIGMLLALTFLPNASQPALAQIERDMDCSTALDAAASLNAFDLFEGAGDCYRAKKELEGSFLLIAGQLRTQSDLGFLKPSGERDEENAAELFSFMYYRAGGAGSDEIYRSEELTSRLFAMIRDWEPALPADYDPGWAYRRRPDERAYFESLDFIREVRLIQLTRVARLLRDNVYYAAHVEGEEIVRRNNGMLTAGTADYERHAQLQAIMSSVSERFPEPEYPKGPRYDFTPDPEADFRQLHAGFNGRDATETLIAWTREEAERSWLAAAMTPGELGKILDQVDFANEMLLIHSIGSRSNLSGALHVFDVDVREQHSSVSLSVRIGVNEEDCDWPQAEAYPFVVAVARKTPDRARSSGYDHGNFGDGCQRPASGRPTPDTAAQAR